MCVITCNNYTYGVKNKIKNQYQVNAGENGSMDSIRSLLLNKSDVTGNHMYNLLLKY